MDRLAGRDLDGAERILDSAATRGRAGGRSLAAVLGAVDAPGGAERGPKVERVISRITEVFLALPG